MRVTNQTAAFECVARRMLGVADDGYEPNSPFVSTGGDSKVSSPVHRGLVCLDCKTNSFWSHSSRHPSLLTCLDWGMEWNHPTPSSYGSSICGINSFLAKLRGHLVRSDHDLDYFIRQTKQARKVPFRSYTKQLPWLRFYLLTSKWRWSHQYCTCIFHKNDAGLVWPCMAHEPRTERAKMTGRRALDPWPV
jgi:hypothetical protein